jgi:hypothetical protein
MTTADIINGLKDIAANHPRCADICEAAAERLMALTAENDPLRRAAELGLEYAKNELAQRKESFAGYPTRWVGEQFNVAFIQAALRGEVEQ